MQNSTMVASSSKSCNCGKVTAIAGGIAVLIFAIVYGVSVGSVVSSVSDCEDACSGYGECDCGTASFIAGGAGVIIGFYGFWISLITSCVGCCCMCCSDGGSNNVVVSNSSMMYPPPQQPVTSDGTPTAAPMPYQPTDSACVKV